MQSFAARTTTSDIMGLEEESKMRMERMRLYLDGNRRTYIIHGDCAELKQYRAIFPYKKRALVNREQISRVLITPSYMKDDT